MKKTFISLIYLAAVVFLLAGCNTALITSPIVNGGPQWKIEVNKMEIVTDTFGDISDSERSPSSPESGNSQQSDVIRSQEVMLGKGVFSVLGSSIPVVQKKILDKYCYLSGRYTIDTARMGTPILYVKPIHRDLGLIRVRLRVTNVGANKIDFSFDRVRLLFPTHVSMPVHILHATFLAQPSDSVTIKPGDVETRELYYVYNRKDVPYRMVYDQIIGNRVANAMVINIPIASREE